jgi:hypothetical protein
MPPAHKQQQTIGLIPPEYETLLKRIEHDQKVLTQFGDEKLHIAQQVWAIGFCSLYFPWGCKEQVLPCDAQLLPMITGV